MVVWFISEVMPKNVVSETMLSSVMFMASDLVANVGLLVAKVLLKLKNFIDRRGIGQVEPGLRFLVSDGIPTSSILHHTPFLRERFDRLWITFDLRLPVY
jgi:hypothetical protein